MKAWISHQIARLILKILGMQKGIDFLVKYRRLKMAADLINNHFDIAAPWPECVASNNWFLRKWDFFNAAQFLIKCKAETAAAIFNEWHKNPKISFKPQAIMGIWLVAPPFAAEMDKAISIIDLIVITNKPLLGEMLTKMPFDAILSYVEKTQSVPLNAALAGLPPEAGVPIFAGLRTKNPDKFEFRMGKLPPATIGLVRAKIREIEAHVVKMKNFEKTDALIGKTDSLLGRLIAPPAPPEPAPKPVEPPKSAQPPAIAHEKDKERGHDHSKPHHAHDDDDDHDDDNDHDHDDGHDDD